MLKLFVLLLMFQFGTSYQLTCQIKCQNLDECWEIVHDFTAAFGNRIIDPEQVLPSSEELVNLDALCKKAMDCLSKIDTADVKCLQETITEACRTIEIMKVVKSFATVVSVVTKTPPITHQSATM